MKLKIRKTTVTEGDIKYFYVKHNPKVKTIYTVYSTEERTKIDFVPCWYWFDKVVYTKKQYDVEYATFDKLEDAEEYVKRVSKEIKSCL